MQMTSAAKKVLDEALRLPDDERRRVVEALLDTMPPDTAERIEHAWSAEIRKRAGKLERGELVARDGDDALVALEARLRGVHRG